MKKYIATAIAAGALAAGGTASAQDLGNIIANILGFGQPSYGYNYGNNYGNSYPGVVANQQIYADQYGRRFYYDQYGRQVYLQSAPQQIMGYDSWGRPIYGNSGTYAYGGTYGSTWDRDGDGIANTRDRWPNDRRYW